MTSVDVIPLGDTRRHAIPEGYDDVRDSRDWETITRRIDGLFPPCWCEPWLEITVDADNELAAIYVHRAADGREATERMTP